ncbi:MAG: hypothetical protein HYR88_19010 [Verrucomicrobia bacterium]|nr:hypothetical protein [Verrucomicrobiota bacterium]
MKTVNLNQRIGKRRPSLQAYTLVEVLFATALTSIMFFAGLGAITFSKVQLMRDRERAVMSDFCTHYIETLKGINFDNLTPGNAINPLYDGIGANEYGKKVTIRIPNDASWVSLNSTNYQSFCPDLAYLSGRNPQMSLGLATTTSGGSVRTRQATLQVRWDAPLRRGSQEMLRMDLLRLRDIESGQ